MDRFTNMMTYTKVVETGSFSEAARRMSISKAVVTKRINQLEALLNVRLLQRSTRRLSVTDSGVGRKNSIGAMISPITRCYTPYIIIT